MTRSIIVLVMLKFRVREPLLAILRKPEVSAAVLTVEPGSVITVAGDVNQFGFVDVRYGVEIVKVFMRDIEQKADLVNGQAG